MSASTCGSYIGLRLCLREDLMAGVLSTCAYISKAHFLHAAAIMYHMYLYVSICIYMYHMYIYGEHLSMTKCLDKESF